MMFTTELTKKEIKVREMIDENRLRIDEAGQTWINYKNRWRECTPSENDYYRMVYDVYRIEKVIEDCECKMAEANAMFKENYDRKNAMELKKMALRKNYELRFARIPRY